MNGTLSITMHTYIHTHVENMHENRSTGGGGDIKTNFYDLLFLGIYHVVRQNICLTTNTVSVLTLHGIEEEGGGRFRIDNYVRCVGAHPLLSL